MTDKERIDRLERLLTDLCLAIWRKENNPWKNFPSLKNEAQRIGAELGEQKEEEDIKVVDEQI